MVREAVPSMTARGGGAILMSTSSSVKEPIQNLGLSTVLRASVSALAKTLSLELASARIRVNQIIPGRIDTDRVRQLDELNGQKTGVSAEQAKARSVKSIPMGRYGQPEEFGRVAAFLLSDAASYMTGATVQVDGGLIHMSCDCDVEPETPASPSAFLGLSWASPSRSFGGARRSLGVGGPPHDLPALAFRSRRWLAAAYFQFNNYEHDAQSPAGRLDECLVA
jgi:hypothetical protein